MRLKHRPWGDEFLKDHPELIKNRENINDADFDEFIKRGNVRLEIGVGRGDFILNMAKNNPDVCFLGVELSGMALAIAGKKILQEEVTNLLLVNMDVHYLFEKMGNESFDIIYLNFSDPWPKDRHARRRLTSSEFLARYDQFLAKNGRLEFKTDNVGLFNFSLEEINNSDVWHIDVHTYDLHEDPMLNFGNVMTEYEEKFSSKGNPICKLIASR